MGHRYYYAPIYSGEGPGGYTDPDTEVYVPGEPCKCAGVELQPGVVTMSSVISAHNIHWDDAQDRVVVRVADHIAHPAGWDEKTPAEVLADYPGIPGVT